MSQQQATEPQLLDWFENVKQKSKDLHTEESLVIEKIRRNFVDRAIVFMDVVGSTAFKQEFKNEPEKWILRVRQFSELLATAVKSANGRVVKFIGDEVMATFENINDAQNLVARISEIEEKLHEATGYITRIKVSADFGSVYELVFDGHEVPDPQGSVVDRCARISKFTVAGEVLASSSFAKETSKLAWQSIGSAELKGLGRETIFQLGKKTIDLEPKIEILKKDFDQIRDEHSEYATTIARLEEQNRQLQQQIKEYGQKPNPDAILQENSDDVYWEQFESAKLRLAKIIDDAPGPSANYARFLFLYCSGASGDTYDMYNGRTFDELIESNIVIDSGSNLFELNKHNRRNIKAFEALKELESALDGYLEHNDQDEDDLFDWSLRDPEFWENYLDYNVKS